MCKETDLKFLEDTHKALYALRKKYGQYATYDWEVEALVTRIHDAVLDLEYASIVLMDRIETGEKVYE